MTIKVDLLPTEKKSFSIDPALIIMLVLIVATIFGCVWYGGVLDRQIQAKNTEIEQINAEIKQIETQLPLIEETKTRIANIKREIQMIKSLVYDPLRYANLLQEVAILLPENVWIDKLDIDPRANRVSFSGVAAEVDNRLPLATVAQLMRNFNESAYFRSSSLASTSETNVEPNDTRAFTFSLEVTYDPEKAANEPPTGMSEGAVPTAEDMNTPLDRVEESGVLDDDDLLEEGESTEDDAATDAESDQ